LIDPGEKYRISNLPNAKKIGDKISERHLMLMGGKGEETTQENQTA